MARPYYTSNDLIEAVKRKAAVPFSQNTFDAEDILKFANEEMFLAQVPSILQYHEEFLVYEQEVTLLSNVSKYSIPNRAIGMKLRDVFYKDNSDNLVEMSKINPDDRSFFQGLNDSNRSPIHYYIQNNSIIVTPSVNANPTGSLILTYFLRPNSLVVDERAAICSGFSKMITIDNTNNLTAGDTITINDDIIIEAGVDFVIGGTATVTASNLSNYINTNLEFTAVSSANIVTISYLLSSTTIVSSTLDAVVQSTITINSDSVPENILNNSLVDFLQTDGGHSILKFDVLLGSSAVSGNTITVNESDLPSDFIVGDYICNQYECIIPQVPSDLHNLLAERTCARVLESLGDQDGLKIANLKIQEQEQRQATLIDNRVDGSPEKITNRFSLLRSGKSRRIRGRF